MSQYRKKPIVIEAHQWHRNGDHPEDYSKDHEGLEGGELRVFTGAERQANGWEGDVVRYYRHPDVPGDSLCEQCGKTHHVHGWIDTLEQGHRVCPGDWIIKGIKGEFYPCKPDIFEATYEKVSAAEQADNAVAGVYIQPSQREILEQALVHGAASEVATVPAKAEAIADGIKTLLDALHPAPVGQELSMINSLCNHANKVMDEGLAHHISGKPGVPKPVIWEDAQLTESIRNHGVDTGVILVPVLSPLESAAKTFRRVDQESKAAAIHVSDLREQLDKAKVRQDFLIQQRDAKLGELQSIALGAQREDAA